MKKLDRYAPIHIGTAEKTKCGAPPKVFPEQNYSNVCQTREQLEDCRKMNEKICRRCDRRSPHGS